MKEESYDHHKSKKQFKDLYNGQGDSWYMTTEIPINTLQSYHFDLNETERLLIKRLDDSFDIDGSLRQSSYKFFYSSNKTLVFKT